MVNCQGVWYEQALKSTVKTARRAVLRISLLSLLFFAQPLLVAFVADESDALDMLFLAISVLLGPGVVFFWIFRLWHRNRWVRHLPIITKEFLFSTSLGEIVADVAARYNLNFDNIDIRRLSFSCREPSPSITSVENRVLLVLPPVLFKIAREKPDVARGLIAHEFAHIVHGDVSLWRISSAAQAYWVVILVNFGLLFVIFAIYSTLNDGWPWDWRVRDFTKSTGGGPAVAAAVLNYLDKVISARRTSELLADFKAATVVGVSPLESALRMLTDDGFGLHLSDKGEPLDVARGLHPSKASRLWSLENRLNPA